MSERKYLFSLILGGALALASPVSAQTPSVVALASSSLAAWQLSTEKLLSALKVSTTQIDASGEQGRVGIQQSRQAMSSTVTAHDQAQRLTAAQMEYGKETGQGMRVCATPTRMRSADIAETSSKKVSDALAAADRDWLISGGDGAARRAQMLEWRREDYCSFEERQRTGWCTGSQDNSLTAAGDTDASTFMLQRSVGTEEAMMAADYIDTVAPLPTIARGAPSNNEEELARLSARRAGAHLTAARGAFFSLATRGLGGDAEDK